VTTSYPAGAGDQSLTRQFIRLFGHRPSARELQQYERARAGLTAQMPARIRRNAARMITRL
jgi:hypothetical protein